jgi:hypothetical protein
MYNQETFESKWSDEVGFWVETEDEDGCQCWHNEVTDEITYDDPTTNQPKSNWVETQDEEGNQCWQNQETDEITYDDPFTSEILSTDGSRWVEIVDEEEYQCWYNEETGETTYDDPNIEKEGEWDEEASGWLEHVDENGYSYWYNEETGETTYDDPNIEKGPWAEMVDDDGTQYWYHEVTGESSFEDPFGETARTVTFEDSALASPSVSTELKVSEDSDIEVARYVSTNEKGNRVFSLSRVSQEQQQLMEVGAVSPYESFQESIHAEESTEGGEDEEQLARAPESEVAYESYIEEEEGYD